MTETNRPPTERQRFDAYRRTAPLEDLRFFMRTQRPALEALGLWSEAQQLEADAARGAGRTHVLRRLVALQDGWRRGRNMAMDEPPTDATENHGTQAGSAPGPARSHVANASIEKSA